MKLRLTAVFYTKKKLDQKEILKHFQFDFKINRGHLKNENRLK